MGLFDFIGQTSNILKKNSESKQKLAKAQELAKVKKLPEAIKLVEEIKTLWQDNPSGYEQIVRDLSGGNLLTEINSEHLKWTTNLRKAHHYLKQGIDLFKQDKNDPFQSQNLEKALDYLQKADKLLYDNQIFASVEIIKQKLAQRKSFHELWQKANQEEKRGHFESGLEYLYKAKKLFNVTEVKKKIIDFETQLILQREYEDTLKDVKEIISIGNFNLALRKLNSALSKFIRKDGEDLQAKLNKIIQAENCYQKGLIAEKNNDFENAKKSYLATLHHWQTFPDINYRLAVVEVKQNNYSSALSYLQSLKGENVDYLRGFIYLQQNQWQKTAQAWQKISNPILKQDLESLSILLNRSRFELIANIEKLVSAGKYEEAQHQSVEFWANYGHNAIIENNLNNHIKPLLDTQIWQEEDSLKRVKILQENWRKNSDITSLHNLTIALYSHCQKDEKYLETWLSFWMTNIFNLNDNPQLKNLSWLDSTQINYQEVEENLMQIASSTIDSYKNDNLPRYFQLRDIFRRDKLALELMNKKSYQKIKLGDILITPSLYQQESNHLKKIPLKDNILHSLYTDWGLAVSACLTGDTERGIQIKPARNPELSVEKYANNLLTYYEGCYHLQNDSWQKAMALLQQVKSLIKSNREWQENIEKLCKKQRQKIDKLEDELKFAESWYNLLDSSVSASYFAEQKAINIYNRLVNDDITLSDAISELNKLKKLAPNNVLVNDVYGKVKIQQELTTIQDLLKRNDYEGAVQKAKYSSHHEVKYRIAKFFIEIVLNAIQKPNSLSYEDKVVLRDIANWAHQICPNEAEFIPLYRALDLY
ncbi:MAG: peptidase M, neutral zinc metallopeptidase, zinc-binding site [Cyanobacterium sp. T60_A2020_053]|nr:peptidase M, neutral zinc metallopeptidase, zinc-binding site [Cyanobacterium sp. T60_A2020_053]